LTRVRWHRAGATLLLLLSLAAPRLARAHPIDSASLSLSEFDPGHFRMSFRAGSQALQEQIATPCVFPNPCRLDRATLDCSPSTLSGTLKFPWLEGTLTRLMVDIEWHDGSHLLRIVTASAPTLTVYGPSAPGLLALSALVFDYAGLGVMHIVGGFDHLCFVIALALLVKRRGPLLATITAFTLAHSLTLGATTLGVLEVPAAPIEAMIALSIVLVCAECLRPAHSSMRRAPWLVAFAFGLLHGLGFASALLEIGLPERHVPSALFSFNLGIELGQLAVIGIVVAARALATRLKWQWPWMARALVYLMGGVAAFWSLDRIFALFQG
jgi:hydrogenase/urease accessory protein HupE